MDMLRVSQTILIVLPMTIALKATLIRNNLHLVVTEEANSDSEKQRRFRHD